MVALMKQEWKKIFRMKAVPLLFFAMFLISTLSYTINIFQTEQYSPKEYLKLHKTIDKDNLEGELERLEKANRTMLFEQVLPEDAITNSIGKEYTLYEQLIQEIKQVTGYESYLSGIKKNAEKKLNSTLYKQQVSTLREAEKVIADFASMEGVQTELFPTKGMDLFLEMDLQDFCLVLTVFLVAAALVSAELEEGTIRLLRCTSVGRRKVVYAKFLAGGLIIAAFWGVLAGVRFVLTIAAYGTECLSGSMVSLNGGMACTLPITIGQGVLLFFGLKLLANLSLYALVLLLSLLLQQPWRVYLFAGGPVAMFWLAYTVIDENSWLVNLKWLNPVAFLDTKTLLLQYKNLILLGHPVTYRVCMIVLSLLLAIFCLLFFGKAFLSIMPGQQFVSGGKWFAMSEAVVGWLTGKRSLGGFELRKWSFYQSGGIVCLLLVLGMVFTYSPVADQVYTEEEIYYRYYVKQVEGVWSEEKMAFLYKEQKQMAEYHSKLSSGEVLDDAVVSYYSQQLKRENGLEKTIQYGEFLQEKGGGTFIYEQGYERLFGQREPITLFLYRCISVAMVAFLSTLLYGVEGRTGMKQLIRISAAGEQRIRRYKWCNTILIGILVFTIVFIPWFYNVFSVYGTNGVDAPAYCLVELGIGKELPVDISVGLMLTAYYGVQLVYLWVVGFASGIVSEKIKNPLVASLTAFGMGLLPLLLFGMN